jgi:hypothetical protein
MKAEQVEVMLELYPLSKGVGNEVASSVAATTVPLLLEEGASVEVAVAVAVEFEFSSARRWRRSSFIVANLQAFGLGR